MTHHARYTIDCEPSPERFAAAYLRVSGDECAVIETYTSHALPRILDAISAAGRAPEDVRWVVVTHAHLDHAAGASALLARCPNATLLAHPKAARHLIDPSRLVASAIGVYGADRFERLYGSIEPIPAARVRALADEETVALGGDTLRVLHTAGHATHHFVVDDPAAETVYTGDAFGLVYPAVQGHGRFALVSASPVDFDAVEARKSIDRILALRAKSACLTHWGEVRDLEVVADQLRRWIDRAERWVTEAAQRDESVETITARLKTAWAEAVTADADARGLGFGRDAMQTLAMDIELNAQGLAVAADITRRRARSQTPGVRDANSPRP